MDITPAVPSGRQVIEAYGPSGFRVSGVTFAGAVIVFPESTLSWRAAAIADVTLASLAAVYQRASSEEATEILLLGCGRRMMLVPPPLRLGLRQVGITIDAMDTGAACRTYDVLLTEGRRVAAALLPPV